MTRWKSLVLILAVWAVSACLADVIFRLLGDAPSADLGGMYAPFEEGTYKLAASVDTDAAWSAGHFSVHTDALGLRCDAARRLAAQPGGSLDVLLLGDSQGFGNGLNYEETLAGATAGLALEKGLKVGNASVGGHAFLNQLRLAKWLSQEHFLQVSNYVVLLTPTMVRNGQGLVRAAVGEDGRLYERQLSRLGTFVVWVKRNTVIYGRLRDAIRNSGLAGKPDGAAPFVLQVYQAGVEELESEARLRASLLEAKQFAASRGARLYVVYIPLTVEVDSSSLIKSATARAMKLDLELPFRVCSSAAQSLELPVFSLKPVLEKFHHEGRALNLKADFHYNADLSRACATSLWTQLKPALASTASVSVR